MILLNSEGWNVRFVVGFTTAGWLLPVRVRGGEVATEIRCVPETLQEDQFAKAATRHFHDADYLHTDGRLPSADHLYGFAAECATKSLLLRFTDVAIGSSKKPEVVDPADPEKLLQSVSTRYSDGAYAQAEPEVR
ncbi:hypothetical protein GTY64_33505 [Streptomyces sp. SID8376]|uniref:hypothetical protein n=1 Tax=Streptomyces sp. FxanaD5 TaxID=1157639 RepID=UPI001319E0B5|nr:hypothetical protein [Streptomyces sp. SID8376]